MAGLFGFLRKLKFGGKDKGAPRLSDVEALRTAFKDRYHSFKLLLAANNKALEIMSEMEHALRGHRPFGMSFIRANCTAVSVNVFRMVQNLDQLAPGKYRDLFGRFKDIQDSINQLLQTRKSFAGDRYVIPFASIDRNMADLVGGKMANLGEIFNNLNLRVPPGFAITSAAQERFFESNDLQPEIDRILQSSAVDKLDELYAVSSEIQQLIIRAEIPEDLERAIRAEYEALERTAGAGVKVSMRSSALGEDALGASFAGQYRSELNVSSENLMEAYKEIVASKYSLQAISYRVERGILAEEVAMSVGCMVMINGIAGGVTYSCNPMNIRDHSIHIHSVWGLPKSVVDGSVTSDEFVVSRSEPPTIVRKEIQHKSHQFVCYPDEGVCRLDVVEEKSAEPSITDAQALELARIAMVLEDHYGCAQDIEWAVDTDGSITLLQCRPLKVSEVAAVRTEGADETVFGEVLLSSGVTASQGVGYGPVYVVRKNSDTLLFPRGSVLVTQQALPRWAALLGHASAVITEQGSAAGHLANVAREFGVPAIFGVAEATEKLENGEAVTVDADALRVYKGTVEALLGRAKPRTGLMVGSPVYEILRQVDKYVVPLNLLDPDSSDFKPRNCRTLHDITRFCHEKSVKEMFSFGNDHHFSERASKQLVCDVPMQWWIINLDDGFREDVPGKFVHLDNIVSIPMLALWEGIVAVPWEGPPPVDSKGFMSILLEASANPALDPSMPSPYVNRNYFMLSRNFCSLSSRFGFHFCTIEALVGERPHENYISFQFKGGAADFQRRLRRVVFVSGILDEYGFRVEVKEDAVLARIEGFDESYMKRKLKMLGYLIIHTRQLDMIMSNDASCNHHREKILKDLSRVLDSRGETAEVVDGQPGESSAREDGEPRTS